MKVDSLNLGGHVIENLGDLYAESGQTLKGSLTAVSKPNFATKYALESSRRDLHNALLCTVLESNPKKRGKPWGEKILVQSRENRPGEAHRQLQLSTQCYPRARSGIKAA